MLAVHNLVKKFGSFTAVNNISFVVKPGELYGFLGPNGAGKTTTIKMITGLFRPTSGNIFINGIDNVKNPLSSKALIGYIPDQPFLYDKLTGREFLYFSGGLYKLKNDYLQNKIDEVISRLQIDNWIDKKTEEYSQGMKQRVTIASSLIHNPKLIVIDEPMVGLDPKSAVIVKELLREEVKNGTAVFMSTHSLSFAEELCTHVGIIKDGNLIFEAKKESLQQFMKDNKADFEKLFLQITK